MGRELPQRTILTSRVTIRCESSVLGGPRFETESSPVKRDLADGRGLVRTLEGKQYRCSRRSSHLRRGHTRIGVVCAPSRGMRNLL
jgi:hypothetical protein